MPISWLQSNCKSHQNEKKKIELKQLVPLLFNLRGRGVALWYALRLPFTPAHAPHLLVQRLVHFPTAASALCRPNAAKSCSTAFARPCPARSGVSLTLFLGCVARTALRRVARCALLGQCKKVASLGCRPATLDHRKTTRTSKYCRARSACAISTRPPSTAANVGQSLYPACNNARPVNGSGNDV